MLSQMRAPQLGAIVLRLERLKAKGGREETPYSLTHSLIWGAIQSWSHPGVTSGVRRVGGEIYFLLVKINAYLGGLSNRGEVTSDLTPEVTLIG